MDTNPHHSAAVGCAAKRRRIPRILCILVGAIVVLGAGFLLYDLLRPEPKWNGRRLGNWVIELRPYTQSSPENQAEAEEAVRAIGANGIPFLLTWIDSEDGRAKKVIFELLPRKQRMRWQPQWAFDRQWSAARTFMVLGTNAEPAVPALARLLSRDKDGDRGRPAAAALAGIGMPAFLVLTNLIVQEDSAMNAAYGLTRFGDMALPILLHSLTHTNQTVHLSAFAGLDFCAHDHYLWKNPDPSRSSLAFNMRSIAIGGHAYRGTEKPLLVRTLNRCLASTNQEVAKTARVVKEQLGL